MRLKKIIIAIIGLLSVSSIQNAVHKYGFNNIGSYSVLIVTYILSVSLSIISLAIPYKLFSKRSK